VFFGTPIAPRLDSRLERFSRMHRLGDPGRLAVALVGDPVQRVGVGRAEHQPGLGAGDQA
jgi:hypothetical protein